MSKTTCPCGHDTTNDRDRYIDDIVEGTRVMGIEISSFLEDFEENPRVLKARECVNLYVKIMKVLPKYNFSYAVLHHTRYMHFSDVSTMDIFRPITEEEFEEVRHHATREFNTLVEPMKKLESDMTNVVISGGSKEWEAVEATQHKLFNDFTMTLVRYSFRTRV